MKTTKMLAVLVSALGLIVCLSKVGLAAPMGTAFTYEGRLIDTNKPADGLYDFQFNLYDDSAGGSQKGSNITIADLDVIDGYFTVELDFGSVFDGNERWLEIGVRAGELDDPNTYITLTPRQQISPTPYAVFAANGGLMSVDGVSNPGGNVDIIQTNAITIIPNDVSNTITVGETHSARTDNPHQVTAAQTGALVSVDGVSNPGGNIDLVAGDNITITPDSTAKKITFSATGVGAGLSIGKVYLTGSGNIVSTDGGTRSLYWDKTNGEIEITNTSGDWCDYWWRAQKGTTTSGDSHSLASGQSNVAIITGTFTNAYGFEVHFGQADGTEGWCSVWLQYANGRLVGHYIKY